MTGPRLFECAICKQHVQLNKEGRFILHRIENRDRYTFCEFSGEPLPITRPTTPTKELAEC